MRYSGGAHEGAKLHERLVVRPRRPPGSGQQLFGQSPERPLAAGAFGVDVWREHSTKDARVIRIDERRSPLISE